jgi:glycine C-acetyltransferase
MENNRIEPLLSSVNKMIADIRAIKGPAKERIISTAQGTEIIANDTKVLNFCANNYLGFCNNPRIKQASMKTLMQYGYGLSSVRFICGTLDIHKMLEAKISQFHKTEDTILFSSCFDANGAVFEALLGEQDAVISDELNHASIIDGIRLCKAHKLRYKHLSMADLELRLQEASKFNIRLIVTDGIFSMDGDVASLTEIYKLACKYQAQVLVDESHATGVFGATGKGTPEFWNLEGKIDIITSTLGKALGGGNGGYITGRKEIIDLLRLKGRPYLFSNAIAPSIVGGSMEAFNLLEEDSSILNTLKENTKRFRESMGKAGFKLLGNKECAIVPVFIGDGIVAANIAEEMMKNGIYVVGFSYPVVPKGAARIRVQISAAHTFEQVDKCVSAFITVGKKKGLIGSKL